MFWMGVFLKFSMKIIMLICTIFFVSIGHAESHIRLDPTAASTRPQCKTTTGMYGKDNLTEFEQSKRFSIPDEDRLIITLYSKQDMPCYTFNFTPELSPFMVLKIEDHQLTIMEMHGSTLNGNWLERKYHMDLKQQQLKQFSKQYISFYTDENGQSHPIYSDD